MLALALLALSGEARAQETRVGDTNDGCDGSRLVTFQGKDGQISAKAGASQRVELPALTSEINWLCGGDRERSANGEPFNVVRITRASNGAITWVFFKSSLSTPSGGADLVRVGDTRDACDSSRHVRFDAAAGEVKVKAGQSKLVELASARNSLDWSCVTPAGDCPNNDTCDEHVSNSITFDSVQIERAGNGAISWVFYRKKNSAPAEDGAVFDFVRNASGNMRVAVSAGPLKKEFPIPAGFLKTKLDSAFTDWHEDITALVRDQLNQQGQEAARKMGAKFALESLTVATPRATELRTAAQGKSLSLKYVAHGNNGQTKFSISGLPDAEFSITFDIELDLSVEIDSLAKPPQVSTAVFRVGHAEIEGANPIGNIAQEVFKSTLRNAKARANNATLDFSKEVSKVLADIFPTAPKDFPASVVETDITVTQAGTVRFCLHTSGAAPCQFAGAPETAYMPRVLDTDVDRCGSSQIWLRDAAKLRFVNIAKGSKNVIVEVDSREFPWFCGGDVGPETNESATGPVGTYLLRVSRAPTGDRIDWSFLSWH